MQPNVKHAVVQEFARDNDGKVNDSSFDNNLYGTRGEIALGVAARVSPKLQLHGEVLFSKGDKIEQPFGVNASVRYVW